MTIEFLTPIPNTLLEYTKQLNSQTIGRKIIKHSTKEGFPELSKVSMALIGVLENRNDYKSQGEKIQLDILRKAFYELFVGNWSHPIVDLGDITQGDTVEDTYYALKTTVNTLLKKKITPIIIGGSQDLTYANYRAYDKVLSMVNLVNVDTNFDLGDDSQAMQNDSYLGKIITEKPYNLFNYANIGYQTYFNSQEEIDLMDKLYFERYRLGEVSNNLNMVEPIMRDAHIVSLDLKSIKASDIGGNHKHSPNGFSGAMACAIARYAGISNKVSSFGVYEYNPHKDDKITALLIAQIIWYFIEGFNFRVKETAFMEDKNYQKYNVLVDDEDLIFYKSSLTGRWWIEIPFLKNANNKLKKHSLLPCTYNDYVEASHGKIPERWFKAYKKNSL